MNRRDWLIASTAVTGSAVTMRFQQQKYSRGKSLRFSGKLDATAVCTGRALRLPLLPTNISEGETLAFALTQKAALVAIDDRKGIRACKLLKLPFSTAIDIVVRMRQKQILTKQEALRTLEALARHGRYSEEIIKRAMAILEGE